MGIGRMRSVSARSLDHILDTSASTETSNDVPVYTFEKLINLSGNRRIALLKVDIEGSEFDLFDPVTSKVLQHIERVVIEYHDNRRPGTLDLLKRRLSATHTLEVRFADPEGYGMLYGKLK